MFVNTETKFIWKNGSFHQWNDSNIHILTHTFHYGLGVFEGVRAYSTSKGPAIFRLNEHTDRLFSAADKVNIEVPCIKEELIEVQKSMFSKNTLDEGYIRPMVYLGSESMGLRATDLSVNIAVAAWEWPSYMSPEAKEAGISIIKSPFSQYSNPLYSGNKIMGSYINSIMALQDAVKKGADEALLMDEDGFISEGSGENIFIIKSDQIYTPKTKNCLDGITRQSVITIAKDFGINVTEKDLTYEDLINADEAFFTGTAVEITPVTKIDAKLIGAGLRGPITKKLQETYSLIVTGQSDQYKSWLTYTNS
jgi:branched-chain amino acid aminotransferase